ncbi:MAG: helix-turn-helix transcriptional regulator [Ruminococcaceae bacterium]|nr:helix-turn-helix transcriptional regulator [Oscillospiraceae bacterium]
MQRIAELRKAKQWNQVALALKLNVSQYLISAYETGRHQPSIEVLKQMAKLFNVSVDYIIENTDIKTPVDAFARNGLTEDEIELLSIFKELSEKEKQRAIGMLLLLKSNP